VYPVFTEALANSGMQRTALRTTADAWPFALR
jgi:hypothetical protein